MGDWIKWGGGRCPVAKGTLVDVRHRDGEVYRGHQALVTNGGSYAARDWKFTGAPSDIAAYRVVPA